MTPWAEGRVDLFRCRECNYCSSDPGVAADVELLADCDAALRSCQCLAELKTEASSSSPSFALCSAYCSLSFSVPPCLVCRLCSSSAARASFSWDLLRCYHRSGFRCSSVALASESLRRSRRGSSSAGRASSCLDLPSQPRPLQSP